MKKNIKILITIGIILALAIIPQLSFAKSAPAKGAPTESTYTGSAPDKTTPGKGSNGRTDISDWEFTLDEEIPSSVLKYIGIIITVLRNISIIVTILVIIILGIKYMLGSVQDKADYKKSYISIIAGVVFITVVTSIIEVIFTTAQNLV